MKTYRLAVARTITRVVEIEIEANSAEEAEAKFDRQLSDLACPELDDEAWGQAFGQALADPYSGEFEVFAVEEE